MLRCAEIVRDCSFDDVAAWDDHYLNARATDAEVVAASALATGEAPPYRPS